jgi:hypothetical protein
MPVGGDIATTASQLCSAYNSQEFAAVVVIPVPVDVVPLPVLLLVVVSGAPAAMPPEKQPIQALLEQAECVNV